MAAQPGFVLTNYIRTTPHALWAALTSGTQTRFYFNGSRLETTLRRGEAFRYIRPNGELMLDGEVVAVTPESRLEVTFIPGWLPEAEPSRVVYEIEPLGEAVKLTVSHYEVEKAHRGVESGWQFIVACLKTYLETGRPLGVAMPGQ